MPFQPFPPYNPLAPLPLCPCPVPTISPHPERGRATEDGQMRSGRCVSMRGGPQERTGAAHVAGQLASSAGTDRNLRLPPTRLGGAAAGERTSRAKPRNFRPRRLDWLNIRPRRLDWLGTAGKAGKCPSESVSWTWSGLRRDMESPRISKSSAPHNGAVCRSDEDE